MTLTQLRYVLAVSRHGNFGKAAQQCLVAQPTLSIQIQKLEKELGVEIFDRNTTPVRLTEPGRRVEARARRILDEADGLLDDFTDTDEIRGRIRLGIIPTISSYLLPKIYRPLTEKYPAVDFHIHELPTSQILSQIRHEELDIGVLATPLGEKLIREMPLYYEPFVAYFSSEEEVPAGPIQVEELRNRELILLGEEHCFRHQSLKLCGKSGQGKIECGSLDTLRQMVDQGLGTTLLPLLSADEQSPRVARFAEPEPVREVALVHGRSFYKMRLLKALRDAILDQIPDELHRKGNRKLVGAVDLPV
jgi:LysR family hydrogen peroxide-inducible transcriptional activator